MSDANLLTLIREYQDKNKNTDTFFSLSTCVRLLTDQDPKDVFIITFGEKVKPPKKVIHKHIQVKSSDFISFQPFVLDTLLISAKDDSVIDKFGAVDAIRDKTVRTVKPALSVLEARPFLAIRAAALISETGYTPDKELIEATKKVAEEINSVDGKIIWREFKRILRADTPSLGINFLHDTGILKVILPELESCYGVDQNAKYHKYTVYEHCLLACDSCEKGDVRLILAALIHDVGKPSTKGENENGITFHKHEVDSTKMTRRVVARFGLRKKDAAFVILMVQNHMYQYDKKWKDSTVRKFIKRVGLDSSYAGNLQRFPLFKLRNADRMGRGLNPVTPKQIDFEARLKATLLADVQ